MSELAASMALLTNAGTKVFDKTAKKKTAAAQTPATQGRSNRLSTAGPAASTTHTWASTGPGSEGTRP